VEELKGPKQQPVVRRSSKVGALTFKAQVMEEGKRKAKQITEWSETTKQKLELRKKAKAEIDEAFNKENNRPAAKAAD